MKKHALIELCGFEVRLVNWTIQITEFRITESLLYCIQHVHCICWLERVQVCLIQTPYVLKVFQIL